VTVQSDGLARNPEDFASVRMQGTFGDQFIECSPAFEVRIYADERFRPEAIAGVQPFNLGADIRRPNFRERTGEPLTLGRMMQLL